MIKRSNLISFLAIIISIASLLVTVYNIRHLQHSRHPNRAIGGTITTNGGYVFHTFTNNGVFEVLDKSLNCEIMVKGGDVTTITNYKDSVYIVYQP